MKFSAVFYDRAMKQAGILQQFQRSVSHKVFFRVAVSRAGQGVMPRSGRTSGAKKRGAPTGLTGTIRETFRQNIEIALNFWVFWRCPQGGGRRFVTKLHIFDIKL